MSKNLSRYGIMIHKKGTPFEEDTWFRDNKHFQVREFSHDAADMAMRILHFEYGDDYSFRIRRLD